MHYFDGQRHVTEISTWHSPSDTRLRRRLMRRIMQELLRRGRKRKASIVDLSTIVRRIEMLLYVQSRSESEYSNPMTLRDRMIGVSILHLQPPSPALQTTPVVASTSNRRTVPAPEFQLHPRCPPFVLSLVCQFLSGAQVYSLRVLHSTARDTMQHHVHQLRATFSQIQTISKQNIQWPRLERFELVAPVRRNYKYRVQDELGIQQFVQYIETKAMPYLRELKLNASFYNSKQINAFEYLCHALKDQTCPHLQVLSVSDCGLGDEGARNLAKMLLPHLSRLERIDFAQNYIGQRGLIHLLGGLHHSAVHHVNLSLNPLTNEAIPLITSTIAKLRHRLTFNLSSTYISSKACTTF